MSIGTISTSSPYFSPTTRKPGTPSSHSPSTGGTLRTGDPGLTATQARRLADAADYLAVAPGVVRVARDVPVGEVADALPTEPADPAALAALTERWGLTTSVARLRDAIAAVG